jgi:glycosyltransferase involved in cell wall biosynthesis
MPVNSLEPRVLHVFGGLDRGGAEIRVLEMLRIGVASPGSQNAVTLSGRRDAVLEEDFRRAGCNVHHLRVKSLLFPYRLYRVARATEANIVHSHVDLVSGYILLIARILRIPGRIAHLRSEGNGLPPGWPWRAAQWLLLKLIDRCATRIVGVSPGVLDVHVGDRWRHDGRYSVLISGIDLSGVEQSIADAPSKRRELGISANARILVHVGRDIWTKNRERAIRLLARIGPDCVLLFVGADDPARRVQLEKLCTDLSLSERVHFLGDRGDARSIIAASDLLLCTSLIEGLPGVVLEAAVAGTPVLSGDLAGSCLLARSFPSVHIRGLTESDDIWASVAREIVNTTVSMTQRIAALRSVIGSRFDIRETYFCYRSVWSQSLLSSKALRGRFREERSS